MSLQETVKGFLQNSQLGNTAHYSSALSMRDGASRSEFHGRLGFRVGRTKPSDPSFLVSPASSRVSK